MQPSVKKYRNAQANLDKKQGRGKKEKEPPASAKEPARQKGGKQKQATSDSEDGPGDAADASTSGKTKLERKRLRRKERQKEMKQTAKDLKAREAQEQGGGREGDGKQNKKKNKRNAAKEKSEPDEPPLKKKKGGGSEPLPIVSLLLSATSSSGTSLGKAAERLKGSRFRWLNQTLYTTTGDAAKKLFEEDPTLAQAYHEGFTAQRAKWPRDPLLDVIEWIRKEVPADGVIGDFGCGEARIALALPKRKIHSFDLVRVNERVTPCNLADVPLKNGTLDVVVFCLALMGTDWLSFMQEAHRCLRPGGLCHIVEVESRFEDFGAVVSRIQGLGFELVLDSAGDGSFFVELRFQKVDGSTGGRGKKKKKAAGGKEAKGAGLGACIYKQR